MTLWLSQIQHATPLNIVLVGVLEFTTDELNRGLWQLQCEGGKTGRELPGIVDEIVTYQFLDFADGKPPERCFVWTSPIPGATQRRRNRDGLTRSSRLISGGC